MSEQQSTIKETGLSHLERLRPDEIVAWLERALQGLEPLPVITPGESPEGPILRWERPLGKMTREDLRTACHTLVRRFAASPVRDTTYVQALLGLATGFGLDAVVPELHLLTTDEALRAPLPPEQLKAVVATLIDLKAPLSRDYWLHLADSLAPDLKLLAMAGLLTCGFEGALAQLPKLPNEEAVADALYVMLDQHRRLLSPAEAAKLAQAARARLPECSDQIQQAITDWLATVPDTAQEQNAHHDLSKLDTILGSFFAKRGQEYKPRSTPARLVHQAA